MTGGSWGHRLQRIPIGRVVDDMYCDIGRRCPGTVTHLSTYAYATGRGGHTAWRRVYMCDSHAERFQAKHNLPEPEVAPVPQHALERILNQAGGVS